MRFVQTTGGRTALPAPRPVRRPPYIQWQAPLVWTTLSLTLHADGRAEYAVDGASQFPRHWIYDDGGRLTHKSGLTDYTDWMRVSFGRRTPWGDEESPALVTAVETALEHAMSVRLMHGAAPPQVATIAAGAELVRQGEPGTEIYLVLDGVIGVERDGTPTGRIRARGPAGRAGRTGGRHQDVHAGRGHGLPGRVRARRAARRVRPGGAGHRAPARRRGAGLRVRIHLCGVRGSTPAPGAEFVRYGGHTSCVAIAPDGDLDEGTAPRLLLDAGTGIRHVTGLLRGDPFAGTILLTHLHWDHVHGLPFFAAGDREDARVTLLLPEQEGGAGAEEVLARGMSPPHFPITPAGLRGDWTFGTLAPGVFKAEGFTVEAREVPHKGGRTFGYRVSDGHSAMAYIPDHCPTALGPGPEGWGEYHPAALSLAADVDVLIHDAFLWPEEVAALAAFGHPAADYAVGLARRAGARRVLLAHHKPDRTDDALDELAARFRADPRVTVAAEGQVIDL